MLSFLLRSGKQVAAPSQQNLYTQLSLCGLQLSPVRQRFTSVQSNQYSEASTSDAKKEGEDEQTQQQASEEPKEPQPTYEELKQFKIFDETPKKYGVQTQKIVDKPWYFEYTQEYLDIKRGIQDRQVKALDFKTGELITFTSGQKLVYGWYNLMLLIPASIAFGLAYWQYYRKKWKEGLMVQRRDMLMEDPIDLNTYSGDLEVFKVVKVTGRFDKEKILFLGPRPQRIRGKKHIGYHVIQPLTMPSGESILVNRGFVPVKYQKTEALKANFTTKEDYEQVFGIVWTGENAMDHGEVPRYKDTRLNMTYPNMLKWFNLPPTTAYICTYDPEEQPSWAPAPTEEGGSIAAMRKLEELMGEQYELFSDTPPPDVPFPHPVNKGHLLSFATTPDTHFAYMITWLGIGTAALVGGVASTLRPRF